MSFLATAKVHKFCVSLPHGKLIDLMGVINVKKTENQRNVEIIMPICFFNYA
jgi:hypothetical protein